VNRCRVHRAHRAPPGPTPRKTDCEIPHLQLPHSVIRSNQCYRGSEHADSFFLFFSAVEFGIFSGLIATFATCQSQPSIPSLIKAHQRTQRTYALARIRRTLQFHTDANYQVFVLDFEGGRTCVVYEADAQDCGRKIYMWVI
jgi:hypothetical protein